MARSAWRRLRSMFTPRELALAVALAVAVRLIGIAVLDYGYPLSGDALGYQLLADNLREYFTFSYSKQAPIEPTALRGPGYAVIVFAVQTLTGGGLRGMQLLQVMIALASMLLYAAAAGTWFPAARRWVLFALALNPFDGAYCAALLTETFATFGVALAVTWLLFQRGGRRWLGAGVIMGLTALTRDFLLVLPLFLAGWLGLRAALRLRRRFAVRRAAKSVALVLAGAAVVIAPWTVRNALTFHRFAPIAFGGLGASLWLGSWERDPSWVAGGVVRYPDEAFDNEDDAHFMRTTDTVYTDEANRRALGLAKRRWAREPVATFVRCAVRERFLWFGTRSELFRYRFDALATPGTVPWRLLKSTQWGLNAVLVVGGLLFLLWRWRSSRLRGLRFWLVPPVAATALGYFPHHSTESRYTQPVLPILIVGCALLAYQAWSVVLQRRSGLN